MIDRRQRERQRQQPPLNPWIPLDDVEDGLYLEDKFPRNEDDIETELIQDRPRQIEPENDFTQSVIQKILDKTIQYSPDQENKVSWQVAQRDPPAGRTAGRFGPAWNAGVRQPTLQTQIAVENLYRKLPFGSSVRVTRDPRTGREIITFEAPPSRNSREERPLSSVPAFISDPNVRAEPLPQNATPVPRLIPQGQALRLFRNPRTGREELEFVPRSLTPSQEPKSSPPASSTPETAPAFIVTPGGSALPVPVGARPQPVPWENKPGRITGSAFVDGQLNGRPVTLRMMDPVPARGAYPAYPNGYSVYANQGKQTIDPYTGRTIAREHPFAHILNELRDKE